jgi:Holliday junction DNA helicase RuvB
VRDFAQVRADGAITQQIAAEALAREGVDENGLDQLDRRYLNAIAEYYNGGPVGIEALAATINEEKDTLVDVIEPYLLKMVWVVRAPGGRKIGSAYAGRTAREQRGLFDK